MRAHRHNTRRALLAILVSCLALAGHANAAGAVRGTVEGEGGGALAGGRLVVVRQQPGGLRVSTTDANGRQTPLINLDRLLRGFGSRWDEYGFAASGSSVVIAANRTELDENPTDPVEFPVRSVVVVGDRTGRARRLRSCPRGGPQREGVAVDGRVAVFLGADCKYFGATLRVIDLRSGAALRTIAPGDTSFLGVALAGRFLAASVGPDTFEPESEVRLYDWKTGELLGSVPAPEELGVTAFDVDAMGNLVVAYPSSRRSSTCSQADALLLLRPGAAGPRRLADESCGLGLRVSAGRLAFARGKRPPVDGGSSDVTAVVVEDLAGGGRREVTKSFLGADVVDFDGRRIVVRSPRCTGTALSFSPADAPPERVPSCPVRVGVPGVLRVGPGGRVRISVTCPRGCPTGVRLSLFDSSAGRFLGLRNAEYGRPTLNLGTPPPRRVTLLLAPRELGHRAALDGSRVVIRASVLQLNGQNRRARVRATLRFAP